LEKGEKNGYIDINVVSWIMGGGGSGNRYRPERKSFQGGDGVVGRAASLVSEISRPWEYSKGEAPVKK